MTLAIQRPYWTRFPLYFLDFACQFNQLFMDIFIMKYTLKGTSTVSPEKHLQGRQKDLINISLYYFLNTKKVTS